MFYEVSFFYNMTTLDKIYKQFLEYPEVSTDSRSITPNSIFFALKGENFDGNKFAINAVESGARFALVDNADIRHAKCIYVKDVLHTLQQLATIHRDALGVKILAITGSNGKTTTKELIYSVLAKRMRVKATQGNLNNHIGVPLTLLSITPETEMAIIEMGANHPGEIALLSGIAKPNYGLITNIGRAHLGGFGSYEGVVKTKGELYEYLAINDGSVFYNPNNKILTDLIEKYNLSSKSIPYGLNEFKYQIVNESSIPFLNVIINNTTKGEAYSINTNLVGQYNLENVISAVTIGEYFGIPTRDIREAIETYTPSNSRSQYLKTSANTIILDAYNANPTSMEASLNNFANIRGESKIAIIGEMLELGDYSKAEHKRIVELANSLNFVTVLFVGKGFENMAPKNNYFATSDDCSAYLKSNPIVNATILVKGSRGVKLEKVLNVL